MLKVISNLYDKSRYTGESSVEQSYHIQTNNNLRPKTKKEIQTYKPSRKFNGLPFESQIKPAIFISIKTLP